MNHPIFLNTKSISVYFGLWILITGIHFSIFYFIYGFPVEISMGDSLTYNTLFCIIGILMWYIVRYSIPDKNNRTNVFVSHLAFLALILVIWNGIPYLFLTSIFGTFKPYRELLPLSIPYRLISGTLFYALLGMAYYLIIYYSNLQEKSKPNRD